MRQRQLAIFISLTVALALSCSTTSYALQVNESFDAAVDTSAYVISASAHQDLTNGYFVVCPPNNYDRGSFFLTEMAPQVTHFEAAFDFYIGGGIGADGMTFAMVPGPSFLGPEGGFLGYSGLGGYAVEIDTYQNSGAGDPEQAHISILKASIFNHLYYNTEIPQIHNGGWFHCDIVFSDGRIQVFLENASISYPRTQVVDLVIPDYVPFDAYFGFTAATGSSTDYHIIDNLVINVPCPPPILTAPPDIVEECTASGGQALDIGQATASSNCCELTITNDAPAMFSMGETLVMWTATDCYGTASTATQTVTVEDMTSPALTIKVPTVNTALQEVVTLAAAASDSCTGVSAVFFYVREPGGAGGVPIGYENLPGVLNTVTGDWERNFDSTKLPDGYYVVIARAVDAYANEVWTQLVPVSIRNWAVVKLLPASENNKAGRTMPVKFALRIARSVDPNQPFVYNEHLEIRIYDSSKPGVILQTSHFGNFSTDYRIDTLRQQYLTNFKTGPKPASYTAQVWRPSKNFLIGSFTFKTVK